MPTEQGFPATTLERRVLADKRGSWGYPPRQKPTEPELRALAQWFVERNLEEAMLERAFSHGWHNIDEQKDPWSARAAMELIREEFISEGK